MRTMRLIDLRNRCSAIIVNSFARPKFTKTADPAHGVDLSHGLAAARRNDTRLPSVTVDDA
jgi:hypothetical protein